MTNPNCSWTTTESNGENGSDNIHFESIRNDVMVWVFSNPTDMDTYTDVNAWKRLYVYVLERQ